LFSLRSNKRSYLQRPEKKTRLDTKLNMLNYLFQAWLGIAIAPPDTGTRSALSFSCSAEPTRTVQSMGSETAASASGMAPLAGAMRMVLRGIPAHASDAL
jgi:hypothetical protein